MLFAIIAKNANIKQTIIGCIYFRGFLLILAVFLKVVDEDTNLLSPRIGKMNEIPIYFVCSEGKGVANKDQQTQLKLSHFIYALKLERDLSYKLEDGCIIVWGSERTPRDNQRSVVIRSIKMC